MQDLPDQPVPEGAVLVIPPGKAGAFWEAAGFSSSGPETPSKSEFRVRSAELPEGIEVAVIDQGTFGTSTITARSLFCLTDPPGDDGALRVRGCAVSMADGSGPVTLSLGIAGVRVT